VYFKVLQHWDLFALVLRVSEPITEQTTTLAVSRANTWTAEKLLLIKLTQPFSRDKNNYDNAIN